jgi:hypothetical protein
MGGGNSSNTQAAVVKAADPAFTGQIREFGAGQGDLVQQQLNMSGLGNFIDPTQFQQGEVPILNNPAEIEAYLKSMGKDVVNADGTVTNAQTNSGSNGEVSLLAKLAGYPNGI